jgi:hypothetical protein
MAQISFLGVIFCISGHLKTPKLGGTKNSVLVRIRFKAYIGVIHTAFGKNPRLYYSAFGREFFTRFLQII